MLHCIGISFCFLTRILNYRQQKTTTTIAIRVNNRNSLNIISHNIITHVLGQLLRLWNHQNNDIFELPEDRDSTQWVVDSRVVSVNAWQSRTVNLGISWAKSPSVPRLFTLLSWDTPWILGTLPPLPPCCYRNILETMLDLDIAVNTSFAWPTILWGL